MSQTANSKEQAHLDEIIARSAVDAEFRRRLIDQPRAAIEETVGVDLSKMPRNFNIRFVEKDPGVDALIVLPDFEQANGELSDAELEAVAGGCLWTCVCTNTNTDVKTATADSVE